MRVLISRFSTTRPRDKQGGTPAAAVRGFKARTLGLLTLACLLVAAPATAQVNYAVSGNTAYVTSSKEPDLNSTARSVMLGTS